MCMGKDVSSGKSFIDVILKKKSLEPAPVPQRLSPMNSTNSLGSQNNVIRRGMPMRKSMGSVKTTSPTLIGGK